MVAQLQMVVSDSQPGRPGSKGRSPVGVYTEVPECGLSQGMCVEVTCTKFVNGISILYLWNIQLTFEQEGFRCNESY